MSTVDPGGSGSRVEGGGARVIRERTTRTRGGFTETKPFWMTSEFLVLVAAVAGVLVAAAVAEDIDSRLAWRLVTYLAIGYMIARGLAKAGSRVPDNDPRTGDGY